jgi:coenzyme F420-0:L-glutamate ligase / coenzyme F420-1:gamma-L-glutamate ligase
LTHILNDFLRSRRSVRRFKPDPVPGPVIDRILTTATYAPSSHNRQPWRFAVLIAEADKARLAHEMAKDFRHDLSNDGVDPVEIERQVARSKTRILAAPLVVVSCMGVTEMDSYPDLKRQQAERAMAVQSVAAAGLQLLLAAHAEGLGGVWVCSPLFAPEAVRNALGLPQTWEPQALYFIGYPEDIPNLRARKPVQDISLFL